jgi:hypothetical protein
MRTTAEWAAWATWTGKFWAPILPIFERLNQKWILFFSLDQTESQGTPANKDSPQHPDPKDHQGLC